MILYYYDYVNYKNYTFYITIENDFITSLNLNKPDLTKYHHSPNHLLKYTTYLKSYFIGIILNHNFKFKQETTPFNNLVYNELLKLKSGEVITYSELAARINKPKAQRAIGNALSKNKILILIPCHLVIRSDGTLGGYALGTSLKKDLINIEKNITYWSNPQ